MAFNQGRGHEGLAAVAMTTQSLRTYRKQGELNTPLKLQDFTLVFESSSLWETGRGQFGPLIVSYEASVILKPASPGGASQTLGRWNLHDRLGNPGLFTFCPFLQ